MARGGVHYTTERAGDFTEEVTFKGTGNVYLLELKRGVPSCHFHQILGSLSPGYGAVGLSSGT